MTSGSRLVFLSDKCRNDKSLWWLHRFRFPINEKYGEIKRFSSLNTSSPIDLKIIGYLKGYENIHELIKSDYLYVSIEYLKDLDMSISF